MRCTVAGLMPCSAAMVRTLQCVAALGLVCSVAATTASTFIASIRRGRPGRGASCLRLPTPPDSKRLRHRRTVGRDTFSSRAIDRFAFPSAAASAICRRVSATVNSDTCSNRSSKLQETENAFCCYPCDHSSFALPAHNGNPQRPVGSQYLVRDGALGHQMR